MDKPEKKYIGDTVLTNQIDIKTMELQEARTAEEWKALGYNKAISDYEAWLPDEKEIEKIVYSRVEYRDKDYCVLCGTPQELAKAISARLKGE